MWLNLRRKLFLKYVNQDGNILEVARQKKTVLEVSIGTYSWTLSWDVNFSGCNM